MMEVKKFYERLEGYGIEIDKVILVDSKDELLIEKNCFWSNVVSLFFDVVRVENINKGKYEKLYRFLEKTENYEKLIEKVKEIEKTRPRDITKYSDNKGRPIINWVKGIVNQAGSELLGEKLPQEIFAPFLDKVRGLYGVNGKFHFVYVDAGYHNVMNGIISLGDEKSCFNDGGCNDGHRRWIEENSHISKLCLMLLADKQEKVVGAGRCWVFCGDNALFYTNIYSDGFDFKRDNLRYTIVRAMRLFMGWERAKFAKNNPAYPIYLNGDGVVVWNSDIYEDRFQAIDELENLEAKCLNCGNYYKIKDLKDDVGSNIYCYHIKEEWNNPVVCSECYDELNNRQYCTNCGEEIPEDEVRYYNDDPYCEYCFDELFSFCDYCEDYYPRDSVSYLSNYSEYVCEYCLSEYFGTCEICDETIHIDDLRLVVFYDFNEKKGIVEDEKDVCNSCFMDIEGYVRNSYCCGTVIYSEKVYEMFKEEIEKAHEVNKCLNCFLKMKEMSVFDLLREKEESYE